MLVLLPSLSAEHLPDTCSQDQDKIVRFVTLCQFWLNIMRLSFSNSDYLILTQTSLWKVSCVTNDNCNSINGIRVYFHHSEMIITARYISIYTDTLLCGIGPTVSQLLFLILKFCKIFRLWGWKSWWSKDKMSHLLQPICLCNDS